MSFIRNARLESAEWPALPSQNSDKPQYLPRQSIMGFKSLQGLEKTMDTLQRNYLDRTLALPVTEALTLDVHAFSRWERNQTLFCNKDGYQLLLQLGALIPLDVQGRFNPGTVEHVSSELDEMRQEVEFHTMQSFLQNMLSVCAQ